jgi:preprotein translocase subunit SecD
MLNATKKYLNHRMAVVFIENKVETIVKEGKAIKNRTTTKDIINAATIQGVYDHLHYPK